MAGSCGGGPAGRQWNCEWFVGESGGHLFVVPKEAVPAVVAARGNMGNAWRVEEEASWPVQEGDPSHQQYHQYGQIPQHNNGSAPALAISTATATRGAPGGSNGPGGDGLLARLKQRFSSSGPPSGTAYARSPDTPSSATRLYSSGGGGAMPPSSAWSNRSFGGAGGGYVGLSGGAGGTDSPTSQWGAESSLYKTTTRGTAYTGASGVSAYEMIGGMSGSSGPGMGRAQQQDGARLATNSPISRAYSKLSRKRTFL